MAADAAAGPGAAVGQRGDRPTVFHPPGGVRSEPLAGDLPQHLGRLPCSPGCSCSSGSSSGARGALQLCAGRLCGSQRGRAGQPQQAAAATGGGAAADALAAAAAAALGAAAAAAGAARGPRRLSSGCHAGTGRAAAPGRRRLAARLLCAAAGGSSRGARALSAVGVRSHAVPAAARLCGPRRGARQRQGRGLALQRAARPPQLFQPAVGFLHPPIRTEAGSSGCPGATGASASRRRGSFPARADGAAAGGAAAAVDGPALAPLGGAPVRWRQPGATAAVVAQPGRRCAL